MGSGVGRVKLVTVRGRSGDAKSTPNPVNSIWIASASAGAGTVAPVMRFLNTQLTAVTWVWAAFSVTVGSIATKRVKVCGSGTVNVRSTPR
jgi:hypothetical protein